MISQPILRLLVAASLLLPIAIAILWGLGQLLLAMGDTAGSTVVGRLALGLGTVWVLDLVVLVIVLGLAALAKADETRNDS